MSWSATFTKVPGATAEETEFTMSNVDEVPEHLEQYREAIAAAFGILLSGVVGDPENKSYRIALGGHGNPNHEPDEDGVMANDFLSINIYQLSEDAK